MDNKTFNNCMITEAAERMVSHGYAESVEEAETWLLGRGTRPSFTPQNHGFAELGAVKTLERVCAHAYKIISYRRSGVEVELPTRVKTYYAPRFVKLVEA